MGPPSEMIHLWGNNFFSFTLNSPMQNIYCCTTTMKFPTNVSWSISSQSKNICCPLLMDGSTYLFSLFSKYFRHERREKKICQMSNFSIFPFHNFLHKARRISRATTQLLITLQVRRFLCRVSQRKYGQISECGNERLNLSPLVTT